MTGAGRRWRSSQRCEGGHGTGAPHIAREVGDGRAGAGAWCEIGGGGGGGEGKEGGVVMPVDVW
jgi:hypothetical protein